MTITLRTLPPSTNNLYVNGARGRFLAPKARAAKEAIGWEARSQYCGEPLQGPLGAEIRLYWPDKRRRDIDNIKALLDALTGILWEDDSQIEDLHITKGYDRARPRVEMDVRVLPAS